MIVILVGCRTSLMTSIVGLKPDPFFIKMNSHLSLWFRNHLDISYLNLLADYNFRFRLLFSYTDTYLLIKTNEKKNKQTFFLIFPILYSFYYEFYFIMNFKVTLLIFSIIIFFIFKCRRCPGGDETILHSVHIVVVWRIAIYDIRLSICWRIHWRSYPMAVVWRILGRLNPTMVDVLSRGIPHSKSINTLH